MASGRESRNYANISHKVLIGPTTGIPATKWPKKPCHGSMERWRHRKNPEAPSETIAPSAMRIVTTESSSSTQKANSIAQAKTRKAEPASNAALRNVRFGMKTHAAANNNTAPTDAPKNASSNDPSPIHSRTRHRRKKPLKSRAAYATDDRGFATDIKNLPMHTDRIRAV